MEIKELLFALQLIVAKKCEILYTCRNAIQVGKPGYLLFLLCFFFIDMNLVPKDGQYLPTLLFLIISLQRVLLIITRFYQEPQIYSKTPKTINNLTIYVRDDFF